MLPQDFRCICQFSTNTPVDVPTKVSSFMWTESVQKRYINLHPQASRLQSVGPFLSEAAHEIKLAMELNTERR